MTKNRYFCLAILILVFMLIVGGIMLTHNVIDNESSLMLAAPSNVQESGNILTWGKVDGAKEYEVHIQEKVYKTIKNELSLEDIEPGEYKIFIIAVSGNGDKYNSRIDCNINYAYSGLKIYPLSELISKVYDGTNKNDVEIKKGIHYELSGLKYGSDVDVTIESTVYNSLNVTDANKLIVNYSAKLIGKDAKKYKIEKGKLELKASVLPKELEIEVPTFTKQFLDKDALKNTIEVDENQIDCTFIRTEGEEIGKYDIVDVALNNANYSPKFSLEDGVGKFKIIKRMLEVKPLNDAVTKIYDGTMNFDISELKKGKHYEINRLDPSFDANIKIISAELNSPNVNDCKKIIVQYSAELEDEAQVYQITEGQFECNAEITAKSIDIFPKRFVKQFGDNDALTQSIQDGDKSFDVEFSRAKGEAVGKYDITKVSTTNENYTPILVESSAKEKFEIIHRAIEVMPMSNAKIEKIYDGNTSYNEPLKQGKHYTIHNIVSGYNAEIKITGIVFNESSVAAESATVHYESELNLGGEQYALVRGSFIIGAAITPKIITVDVPYIAKQFGDADALNSSILIEETNERVEYTLIRTAGEVVGGYNVLSTESSNANYGFVVEDGVGKFRIDKRIITATPTGVKISKQFNNNASFYGSLIEGNHYAVNNLVNGYPITINFFNVLFNDKNTSANIISAEIQIISDCYVLGNSNIEFSAEITKKQIEFEPTEISVQYGDKDHLQSYITDSELSVTIEFLYARQSGNNVGAYDLLSASSGNQNYNLIIKNGSGAGKYIILPRKLNVKVIDGISFTKKYDNSTQCNSPILQGFHYELENLIGGSDVNIRIISKSYDNKNVSIASKVTVSYDAILVGADGANYETTKGVFEFPASITPKILDVEPYKYIKKFNESESLSQNYFDETTGETVTAYFSREGGETVRLYDILSADSRNVNFSLKVINGEGKFEIIRNDVIITAYERITRYNKTAQGIVAPLSQPGKDLIVEYRLIGQTLFTEMQPIDAGQYEVKISFEGDDGYNALVVYKSLVIERIESIITDITPTDYVYDGSIKKVIAQLNHDETQLIYSSNSFVNAGEYRNILISSPQTTNYKASSIVVSLKISKYTVQNSEIIYPTPSTITYGQFIVDSRLDSGSKYGYFEWTDESLIPTVNNSGFTARFVPFDTLNYDWSNVATSKTLPLTVQKLRVTVAPPTAEKVNYGDALSASKLNYDSPYGAFEWQNGNIILTKGLNYCDAVFYPYDFQNYDWSLLPTHFSVLVEVYYPIVFETYGGSSMANLLTDILNSQPTATKKGYVFEGWFLDEAYQKQVVYPYSVTAPVKFYALWRTKGISFEYDSSKDGYIVSFDGENVQKLSIPLFYKGKPVVAVADNAFMANYNLKYVTVPLSVKTIGSKAFYNCRNLIEIHIGEDIENLLLGEDWNKTTSTTDIHFQCKPCAFCDGTTDCHIDCPYCAYCGNTSGEHNACLECNQFCDGSSKVKFCLTCGKCNNCVDLCPGCGTCVACNESNGKQVCDKCHWCNNCNAENGFEYCVECGNCNSCHDYCQACKRCQTHCICGKKRIQFFPVKYCKFMFSMI